MGEQIVILGAGIIGLYTALHLTQQNKAHLITIVAEYLPGDQSANYTSPWAGGNFSCASKNDAKSIWYDRVSFQSFDSLISKFGPDAGIAKLPIREYFEAGQEESEERIKAMKSYIPDFELMKAKDLPEGKTMGFKYTTFNFNCPKFLQFLKEYLTKQGVTFIRRWVNNINDAFLAKDTKIVFNCTGIGARHLGGVEDEDVFPTRGQVVVIKAPHIQENMAISSNYFVTYVIPRPYSGGHVILGGYQNVGDWRGDTFGHQTQSILERNLAMLPKIGDKPIEIVREAAGLRPSRKGGVRIERQDLGDGRCVIHNYGASGAGYQSGYGMALEAVSLLESGPKL